MPRGTELNEFEKGQIDALHKQGLSLRKIAMEINRSHTVVQHYLNLGENYCATPRSGRRSSLSDRDKRAIIRHVDKPGSSSTKILKDLQLNCSKYTVLRAINSTNLFEYSTMDVVPRLTELHKQKRMDFANKYIT